MYQNTIFGITLKILIHQKSLPLSLWSCPEAKFKFVCVQKLTGEGYDFMYTQRQCWGLVPVEWPALSELFLSLVLSHLRASPSLAEVLLFEQVRRFTRDLAGSADKLVWAYDFYHRPGDCYISITYISTVQDGCVNHRLTGILTPWALCSL